MTMQQQTQPLGLSWLWSQLDEAHRKDALKNLAEWGNEYYERVMDSAWDTVGLVVGPPEDRLGFYFLKTIDEWEEQRAKYPADFEKDQADFQRLREREASGELVATRFEA